MINKEPNTIEASASVIFDTLNRNTRRSYLKCWKVWRESVGGLVQGNETSNEARLLLMRLKSKQTRTGAQVALSTVRNYIVILKAIYDRLEEVGAVTTNPFRPLLREVKKGSTGDRRPTKLTPFEAVDEMFNACANVKAPVQCRAMLSILYGAGRRIGELKRIQVSDIKYTEGGHLYIQLRETKNGNDFAAVIPDNYKAYIEEARDLAIQERRPRLFEWYNQKTFYRHFKELAEMVGLEDVTPHSGRATAITYLLSAGMDYQQVKEFSGHSSIQMVAHYDKRRFEKDNSPALKINFGGGDKE